MLNLSGADWQPRFVDYFNGETRSPGYRAINAMGEVPVLQHEFDVDWASRPNIQRWLERIRSLPGWKYPYQRMPGHPLPARS